MKSLVFVGLAALSVLFVSGTTRAADDGLFHYTYEITTAGEAPYLLSLEGWDAPHLAEHCTYNSGANESHCAGSMRGLSILPHGIVFIRGGVKTGTVKVKVTQICRNKTTKILTDIPTTIAPDGDPFGFFYIKLDAALNPCGDRH